MHLALILALLGVVVLGDIECPWQIPALQSQAVVIALCLLYCCCAYVVSRMAISCLVGNDSKLASRICRVWHSCCESVWPLLALLLIAGFDWPKLNVSELSAQTTWSEAVWALAAVLLVSMVKLLPIVAPLTISWFMWADYDSHSRDRSAANGGRWGYVDLHVRYYFALLVPITWLAVVIQYCHRSQILAEENAPILLGGVLLVLVALMPRILRQLWRASALEEGAEEEARLLEQISPLLKRAGMRTVDVLLWNTHGRVVNALVAGFQPFRRYLFVTDRLLDDR